MTVDPITLSVVQQALSAIPDEMETNLVRTAYSTILREVRDCSTALFDRQGRLIGQARIGSLFHTGGLPLTLSACAAKYRLDEMTPDDAFLTNDPYSLGQHMHDIQLFTPIFMDGELIGFAGSVAHYADIGGGEPAFTAGAKEIFSEGFRIPPLKISVSRDWIEQGTVRDLLLANSRLPHLMLGDMSAQFSANRTGAVRLEALARRYGKQTILETVEALLDYSELRTRSAIRSIPAGRYVGEEWLELDPLSSEPAHIVATVEVREDELDVDFSGTSGQVAGPVNSPLASTMSAVYAAIRVFLRDRSIPYNDGCTRPVRITVPLGSLLNPRFPAALRARMNAAYRAHGAVARALGLALPERAVAPGYDSASMVTLSYSPSDGKYEIFQDMVQGGGTGAGPNHDGVDAVGGPMTSSRNTPAEAAELDFGFIRIVRSELAADSGGAGRYRGGLGVRRDYEVLRDGVIYSGFTARGQFPADGANGGLAGGTGGMWVIREGQTIHLPSTGRFVLQRGDILSTLAAGGGGFGDPIQRERSLVERDLREGKISLAGARAFGAETE